MLTWVKIAFCVLEENWKLWGRQRGPQAGEGLCLEVKEKLRHRAQFLLSVHGVLHVVSSQQVLEQQNLFVWADFAVLYLLLPSFAWADLLLLLCYMFTPVLVT